VADIRQLIDNLEPKMRAEFTAAIRDITSRAQIGVIVQALADGRIDDAIRALHLSPAAFSRMDDVWREAYVTSGRDALAAVPAITIPFPQWAWWFVLSRAIRVQKDLWLPSPAISFNKYQTIN
jgi:hypothetical protein